MSQYVMTIDATKCERHYNNGCTITHLGPVVFFEYDKEMSEALKGNERYLGMGIKNCDVNFAPDLDHSKGIVIMAGWGEKTGRYTLNIFHKGKEGSLFFN